MIAYCEDCKKAIEYKTKKPKLCKECRVKKYGDRKFYRKPKGIPKKSKGEYVLSKILNEMFPQDVCIDGGYYSFLPSPKGYSMQLDRYYPRLFLAFEFNGKQHEEDSEYMYRTEEEFNYRKECDHLKWKLCRMNRINIIYIGHDEYITKDLIYNKLIEANVLDYLKSRTVINF